MIKNLLTIKWLYTRGWKPGLIRCSLTEMFYFFFLLFIASWVTGNAKTPLEKETCYTNVIKGVRAYDSMLLICFLTLFETRHSYTKAAWSYDFRVLFRFSVSINGASRDITLNRSRNSYKSDKENVRCFVFLGPHHRRFSGLPYVNWHSWCYV